MPRFVPLTFPAAGSQDRIARTVPSGTRIQYPPQDDHTPESADDV